MRLLAAITVAINLASALALNIPGADVPNAAASLVKRAKACTYTATITEKYPKSGQAATKTVYKEVIAKPTPIDCGDKWTCSSVLVKTVTKGTPVRVVYGSVTTANLPYCTPPVEKEEEGEGEEEGEEEEEE